MKITLTSTEQLVDVDGSPARVWEGTTEDGVRCVAFIRRIAVRADAQLDRLERELIPRQAPPSGPLHEAVDRILGDQAIDARLLR